MSSNQKNEREFKDLKELIIERTLAAQDGFLFSPKKETLEALKKELEPLLKIIPDDKFISQVNRNIQQMERVMKSRPKPSLRDQLGGLINCIISPGAHK